MGCDEMCEWLSAFHRLPPHHLPACLLIARHPDPNRPKAHACTSPNACMHADTLTLPDTAWCDPITHLDHLDLVVHYARWERVRECTALHGYMYFQFDGVMLEV